MEFNYTYVATAVSATTNEVYTSVASYFNKDCALNALRDIGYNLISDFHGSAMVIDLHTGNVIGKAEF